MSRILLVEDNELNRDMLSRRLARKGYEVAIAVDGNRALEAARSGSFDLILMDLSLPGIDGWSVARMLKADDHTRAIPVIALTAHAMAGDRERAIEAGCDDYDIKPVEFPRLLAKIESILRSQGAPTPYDELNVRPEDLENPGFLRHNLIGPVSRVLGYCELLAEEAKQQGKPDLAQSLRAIWALGQEARHAIDDSLLHWRDNDGPIDLGALISRVVHPSHRIIHACDALEEANDPVPPTASFLDDLDHIRQDAALLISMVWQVGADPARTSGRGM
jgi:two-component system cell cycle response regulator DivK